MGFSLIAVIICVILLSIVGSVKADIKKENKEYQASSIGQIGFILKEFERTIDADKYQQLPPLQAKDYYSKIASLYFAFQQHMKQCNSYEMAYYARERRSLKDINSTLLSEMNKIRTKYNLS